MARTWTRPALPALALVCLASLAGCANSPFALGATRTPTPVISGIAAGVPSVSLSPTGSQRTVRFHTTLTSKQTNLHTVGPHEKSTYGGNDLVGGASLEGKPAEVELQGSVWYVDGTGPFDGFLTLTTIDGAVLGLQVTGHATRRTGLPDTDFVALLTVIGGTQAYANASGTGTWTGSRTGALGGAVVLDVTLELTS